MMAYHDASADRGDRIHLRQLYARILDDVEQGRDVLWMFPRGADVVSHLDNLRRLADRYLRVEVLDGPWKPVVTVDPDSVGRLLRARLTVGGRGQPEPPPTADLWLLGPGAIPSGPPWAGGSPASALPSGPMAIEIQPPPGGRPPVVIPLDASQWPARLPGSVRLSIRRMWGCTSWGDMHQLARALLGDGEEAAYSLWAASVWVELAGADEALLRQLVEQRVAPSAWRAFLEAYADRRGWYGETLRMARDRLQKAWPGLFLGLTHPDQPPVALWELWAEGMVDLLRGQGVEVHSAILAALKWERLLRHRIWRGQVRHLFPLIDQARLLIAQELGPSPNSVRGALPGQTGQPGAGVSDDEWPCPPALREIVAELRRARNQLAHYEPLDWETHRAVVAALAGLQRHQPTRT